jgi:thiol:disulfide interchange protein DsbD
MVDLMKNIFIFFLLCSQLISKGHTQTDLVKIKLKNLDWNTKKLIAIEINHEKKWHTYWKNPGDSGLPLEFNFLQKEKTQIAKTLNWPVPQRHIEEGDIWVYGYEGTQYFFLEKPNLESGEFELEIKWLVCKDICLPGSQKISGKISNNKILWDTSFTLEKSEEFLKKQISKLPEIKEIPNGLDIQLIKNKENFTLNFVVDQKIQVTSNNVFIPYPSKLVSFSHENIIKNENDKFESQVTLDWIGQYQEPEISFPKTDDVNLSVKFIVNGVSDKPFIIEKTFSKSQSATTAVKAIISENNSVQESESDNTGLGYILLFAFIGGLILNLMPCVLPIISFKLYSIIKSSSLSRKQIIKKNGMYSLGVISSLTLLGLLIAILKSTGQIVGWGFQLQSPMFVAIMTIVLFLMTLNLFGLFEFATPGGRKLGSVDLKDTLIGDFLSGVLATILSTPCSAPFLGTALAFALSSSTPIVFLVFLMIGIGLSFPFILTMVFPGALKIFPKPGAWMNTLKYFLGTALALTIIWLLGVLNALLPSDHLFSSFLPLLVMIFLSIFIFQKTKKISFGSLISFVAALFFCLNLLSNNPQEQKNKATWEKWTEQKTLEYKDKNETAFIDFTAKWCLTCQVNKKLVLNTQDFYDFAKEKNIQLLQADWTKKDEEITQWLSAKNIAGVPAYFLIHNGKIIHLGETISIQKIKELL